ncbi:RNA ligase/cyclic nucleotide phosphodiesterase [Pseudocohnilembus persalinus]|uniref:RNA ligase/cyclic nucleotide phosphodiesterase n=1 Tax=Pseudocohnilembus persalinus TaxID=266149 RepID=A0A0V0QWQ2_PSEPJ|nr:RNA ligase/cyclic nucleotide phosphodiesterase [Pseudocohnilembus persalinus]|eukprot:KRX06667.1 RNA ligase/cyclic nucleotide phosphodiesterase [Pseudocohnilembus persalinus]
MEKKSRVNYNAFTHFISIPFLDLQHKQLFNTQQQKILQLYNEEQRKCLKPNNIDLFHITLIMLALPNQEKMKQAQQSLQQVEGEIYKILNKQKLPVKLGKVDCFKSKKTNKNGEKDNNPENVNIIYRSVQHTPELLKISNLIIKQLVEDNIVDVESENFQKSNTIYDVKQGIFRPSHFHLTLFRVNPQESPNETLYFEKKFQQINQENQEIFIESNRIDISTRFQMDSDKYYLPLHQIILSENIQVQNYNQEQIQQNNQQEFGNEKNK